MKFHQACVLAGVLALASGCSSAGPGGTVEASWTSSDSTVKPGHWAGRGEATWCEREQRLVLLAMARDTGVGILLNVPRLEPGAFPIGDTVQSRPRALLVLRLPAEELEGYTASQGTLELTGTGRILRGRYTAQLARSTGGRSLALEGNFSRVPVVTDSACVSSQSDTASVP